MKRSFVTRTLLGAAFGAMVAVPAATAQDLKPINFMSSNDGSCSVYPQFAMQAFGYLEDEGYRLQLLNSDTSVPYVAFLQNGDADIAMLDAIETLTARASGSDIKVVYETHQFAPEGIVVLADSDITELEQLKGKKIGLAEQPDEITTAIALDSVGLSLSDVTSFVIGNQGPVMARALLEKQVDAFAGGSSDRASLEAQGVVFRNITPDAISRNPGNSLVVWGPTLEEKRPMIQAFVRAWAAAQSAGPMDIKAVAAACKTFIPEQFENWDLGLKMIGNSVYTTQLRRTFNAGDLQPDVWAAIQPGYMKAGIRDLTTEYIKAGIAKWEEANPDKVVN